MRKPNEMTTREAADHLDRHIDTIKRWAREALAGRGRQLTKVRIDASGLQPRYFLDRCEVESLASREPTDWL